MAFYRFELLLSDTVCRSGRAVCTKNMEGWNNVWLKERIIERLDWSLYAEKVRKKVRIHSGKYDQVAHANAWGENEQEIILFKIANETRIKVIQLNDQMIGFKQTKEINKKSIFSQSLPLCGISLTQAAANNESRINSERDENYSEGNPY